MATGAELQAVHQQLDGALVALRTTALAAGPSALVAWDALLAGAHLQPRPIEVRLQRYSTLKLTRGALPDEYRAAVQVAARKAAGRLAAVVEADPEGTDHHGPHASACGVLRARLVGLVDREGAAYDSLLRPKKPGGSLGGVFARARASSALDPWKHLGSWSDSITLSCTTCGAPQQVALEFDCHYCHTPLFREGFGWD